MRLSISGLMILVVACGVALAALRNAGEAWAGLLLLIDLGAVGMAVLGVVYLRGRERAWWLGFGLFGGAYLTLTLAPVLSERIRPESGRRSYSITSIPSSAKCTAPSSSPYSGHPASSSCSHLAISVVR